MKVFWTSVLIILIIPISLIVWSEIRQAQFNRIYNKIYVGQPYDDVVTVLDTERVHYEKDTSGTLEFAQKIGWDSSLVLDITFDEKNLVIDKSANDTAVISDYLF